MGQTQQTWAGTRVPTHEEQLGAKSLDVAFAAGFSGRQSLHTAKSRQILSCLACWPPVCIRLDMVQVSKDANADETGYKRVGPVHEKHGNYAQTSAK